jgi:hypothetical protein
MGLAGKEQGDNRRRRRAGESDTLKVVSPPSEGAAPLTGPSRGRAKAPLNAVAIFKPTECANYLKVCGSS